ncbi:fungal zn(2)-Cys(6) binuclear cluster domain-containing protein [Hirsutella rhossiliensis]|uniref:Fungal zn(2)-Cys(6) binuclear cluster domain-containing protein n=1 Tax=Hirsutella rhossiliensis TaxID=111463 RepID=A0A9P8N768_9HYPO|nr:fungal zn(2)-Cys(6) binuclear cluster domain-containing protein [Hirsutella rhossiliensis]KAH0965892.1 fungal zn(2)-Cys(6) binuclear cluster domain-containing protein [Hirsutella rhossiliensis]
MESPAVHDADGPAALAANSPDAAAPSPPPTKRRRTAPVLADCCRTCRLRKVKCSGNPGNGPCSNCARLELGCNFASVNHVEETTVSRTTPSHSHTEAGTLRKRAQRACSQCHSHKTKCSGDLPRCKRCEAANLPCEYTPAKRRFTNVRFQGSNKSVDTQPPAPGSAAQSDGIISPTLSSSSGGGGPGSVTLFTEASNLNAEDILARKHLILRHMDAYMDNVYWLPSQGFVHPDSTYREIHEGTLDPVHAAGICAVASSFVNPTETGREFAQRCSTQIELYLFQNVYKFSDDLLILFALNITFNVLQGSFAKVWQCFGIASRLMLGLRINWHVLPRGRSFIQQESLRRIGWHFFHMDRMLAGGYDEYICCRAENMRIPLPCDEAAYRENRPVVAERLYDKPGKPPSSINLHAFQIRLIDIRHRIQVITKRLCSASGTNLQHVDASKIMADINGLQNELTRFHSSLPSEVRLCDQSISRFMASPERPGYVFLHCHLAGCHIDLYRFFLPGQKEKIPLEILRKLPREFLARSQKQAVAHSMSFARFCDAIQNEVAQMRDTGKQELAADYSTIQVGTACVRVLLVAIQHQLFRDISQETTAPLWRLGKIDEAHLRFLIKSVQRVTEPWCGLLNMAQQAYDHNKTLVEEFDKSKRVADQRCADRAFRPRTDGDNRLPGTDSLSGADRWFHTPQMPTGPALQYPTSPASSFGIEPGTPGIPLLLAQARTASMDPSEMAAMYDSDNTIMGLTDLTGALPDGNPLMTPNDVPLMQINGSIDPAMYQQAPPGPSPGFALAQQGIFMDGYTGQFANGHREPNSFGQQTGYG